MRQRVGWLFIAILLPIPLLTVSLQPIPAATEESAVSAQASGVPGPSRHGERLPAVSSRAFPTDPAVVMLSEIAWAGTMASASDEWIELYNPTDEMVDLAGWTLGDGNDVEVALAGTLPAGGFFLLERSDDQTVSDVPADQIYAGSLSNSGELLLLRDPASNIVDGVAAAAGWPAGTGSPDYRSMERGEPDPVAGWLTHSGLARNGFDAAGNPIAGTPGQPNSAWLAILAPDLALSKAGPPSADIGDAVVFTLNITNNGAVSATGVLVTDTLPPGLEFVAEDSGLPLDRPDPAKLVWSMATLSPGVSHQFEVTTAVLLSAGSVQTNSAIIWSQTPEAELTNNAAVAAVSIGPAATGRVLIDAVLADGVVTGDLDEAVCLINVGTVTVDLGGWSLSDSLAAGGGAIVPAGTMLHPNERLWLARDGLAFSLSFGHLPDFQVVETVAGVPLLAGAWPGYSNAGDEVVLRDESGLLQDVLMFKAGDAAGQGWVGPAVEPYAVGSISGSSGQVLYRKRDQRTGLPVPDTDSVTDWAQDPNDLINGRKVRYPGWDLEAFFHTVRLTETARITVAIAPDNAFEALRAHIDSALHSIQVEALTFENWALAEALVAASGRGVDVTVLLEGGPTGGITDQEKAVCERLEQAGAACWFMVTDADAGIADRYGFLHAKFVLVDGVRVAIGSENLSLNSMPTDDKTDGTTGRRGVYLITDAPGVVAHVAALFAADFEPRSAAAPHGHTDLRRWSATDPVYGPPSPGFVPIESSGGISYTVRYAAPASIAGTFAFEIVQSPENSLRDIDALLGLIAQAGPGDTILSQQLDEPPFWTAGGNGEPYGPNLRLEALIAAARRGTSVRLLLDEAMDDRGSPTSNRQTCATLGELARREALDLQCATANPTGLGIHNKMVLANIRGNGVVHVGSLNGSEQSSKANRELALQVSSNELFALLADVFNRDWPHRLYLPGIVHQFQGAANHALITEVLVDPTGPDDGEYIELANPTAATLDLTAFALGDAVELSDFEDVRRFPPGTTLAPGAFLVVALRATAFRGTYGWNPDFEVLDSDPTVADLLDDPSWGDAGAFLQLGNTGDEVILRDPSDEIVDLLVYGSGQFPGVVPCPLVANGHALSRAPWWLDRDICVQDFTDSFPPRPGQ